MKKRLCWRVALVGTMLATNLTGCLFATEPRLSAGNGGGTDGPPVTNSVPGGMSTTDSLAYLEIPVTADGGSVTLSRGPEPAAALGSRILNVRFAPQVPPGSWSLTMSCGPAAVNLAAAYAWGAVPDQVTYIRAINSFLGKSDINNCLPGGSSTSDLERAAKAVNNCPNTYKASGWSLARLRQEIDAGRPVVVAVRAGYLPNRGYTYTGGHFVLVVGYTDGHIVTHDVGTSGGANKYYANANFSSAMAYYGGSVVVVRR